MWETLKQWAIIIFVVLIIIDKFDPTEENTNQVAVWLVAGSIGFAIAGFWIYSKIYG